MGEYTQTLEALLKDNTYPGRGIVVGKSNDGKFAVVSYFIMGRSLNSQNRIFKIEDDCLFTKAFDESKVKDPSLIIYRAMAPIDNKLIVTNGDQTDTIYQFLSMGKTFEDALNSRTYEPDAPNYTPRISSILSFDEDFSYIISILKKAEDTDVCERFFYPYKSQDGIGHMIHTYECDGNPIPSFAGVPREVEISNDIEEFSNNLWDYLDSNNKVSLFTRFINLETKETIDKIINKNI